MKRLPTLLSRISLFAMILFMSCEQTPAPPKKFMISRVHNLLTTEAEIKYLRRIDQINVSPELLKSVQARLPELDEIRAAIDLTPEINLNIARCLPDEARVPPLPCPVREDLLQAIPMGTEIELDLVGVYQDVPENPAFRVSAELGSAVLTTTDGKKVFAQGELNSYDKFFRTAWYQFDVKNPSLAKKPLILKVTTTVIVNQQAQTTTIQIPVPASTLLANNFY